MLSSDGRPEMHRTSNLKQCAVDAIALGVANYVDNYLDSAEGFALLIFGNVIIWHSVLSLTSAPTNVNFVPYLPRPSSEYAIRGLRHTSALS